MEFQTFSLPERNTFDKLASRSAQQRETYIVAKNRFINRQLSKKSSPESDIVLLDSTDRCTYPMTAAASPYTDTRRL